MSSRTDLCGGCRATGIPTAIPRGEPGRQVFQRFPGAWRPIRGQRPPTTPNHFVAELVARWWLRELPKVFSGTPPPWGRQGPYY